MFLYYVIGEEVIVLTDGRRGDIGGVPGFYNVLIPTVYGRCDKDREGKQRVGRGIEVSRGLVEK